MSKRDGLWSLTEAGEAAFETYDAAQLAGELNRRFAEIRRQRVKSAKKAKGVDPEFAMAISVIEPGLWTSCQDVAGLSDASPKAVERLLQTMKPPIHGGHRVIRSDGSIPDEDALNPRYRGGKLLGILSSEGVVFDPSGHASEDQRMSTTDLSDRINELGEHIENNAHVPRRCWFINGSSVEGRELLPTWLKEEWISLAAGSLRPVSAKATRQELWRIIEDDYAHEPYFARERYASEFTMFLHRMRIGDLFFTVDNSYVNIGTIESDAYFVDSEDHRSNLRRAVSWSANSGLALKMLPSGLRAKLQTQSDLVDLTEYLAVVERLSSSVAAAPGEARHAQEFPRVTDELAKSLLLEGTSWLSRQVDLLWERKQVIFYGPPGTGKTHIARSIADHVADPNAIKLVQFHPSYTYEDFFEGLRPEKRDDGKLIFDLRPGPLRLLVDAAKKNPEKPYILIIDEINRANLPKVFGELYFSLEYRDQPISLLYSPESNFTLPQNFYILGTMNTADRSVALLDAAIRRRFAFVELHPSKPPADGILGAWIANLDDAHRFNRDAPAVLDFLNKKLNNRELSIGPSYLMRPEIYSRADGLDEVWETSILPLLAEYHHGASLRVLRGFELAELRSEMPNATG
ncbi:AAA family ATPase [Amycolatopsis sp. NPDC051102]|uniref:McrB family protein n=1 Tax=Amycolatopsis sp. NPDC051102 TaxID=3155163 RepID=UPI003449B879